MNKNKERYCLELHMGKKGTRKYYGTEMSVDRKISEYEDMYGDYLDSGHYYIDVYKVKDCGTKNK